MPDDLKRKAFFVFEKLWLKKAFVFSTQREFPTIFFQNDMFKDGQLKKIYDSLPLKDASALLLGLAMREEINRAQHEESEKIKKTAYSRYGQRGETITNLVTTNDIANLADEIAEITDKTQIKRIFDEWTENYPNISILVSPEEVGHPASIKSKIVAATKSLAKPFIIVNMCSNDLETISKLVKVIESMNEEKLIKYKEFVKDEGESGFYFYFKGTIRFR